MLPLISSLTTEFAGLPGDSAADLPVGDESGSLFAGILRQSVAVESSAEHRLPVGNGLPPDGKILPLGLKGVDLPMQEIELPVADCSDHGPLAAGSADSATSLYALGLMPRPTAAAIAGVLGEVPKALPSEIEQAIGALADLDNDPPVALPAAPIAEPADPNASPVTPSLALITEQRLRERTVPIEILRKQGPATSRPTDVGLAAVNVIPRGSAAAQSPVAPAPLTDFLNWTAASIPDGPTAAVQASKVAAEAFGGATTQLTSGPLDASASQNSSLLSAHVSIAGTAPLNPTAGAQVSAAAMHVGTPVQDAAWSNELGSRVVLMSGQQLQSARIQLSPAELGPITVNLVVDDGSAELTFHAHHALTRDAIEQALPRLREMLNDNGLTLGNATVSDQGVARDGSGHAARDASGVELSTGETTGRDEPPDAQPARILQGLLDTFV
jgi:flagellar hook-length control protein FliK